MSMAHVFVTSTEECGGSCTCVCTYVYVYESDGPTREVLGIDTVSVRTGTAVQVESQAQLWFSGKRSE